METATGFSGCSRRQARMCFMLTMLRMWGRNSITAIRRAVAIILEQQSDSPFQPLSTAGCTWQARTLRSSGCFTDPVSNRLIPDYPPKLFWAVFLFCGSGQGSLPTQKLAPNGRLRCFADCQSPILPAYSPAQSSVRHVQISQELAQVPVKQGCSSAGLQARQGGSCADFFPLCISRCAFSPRL